MLSIITIPGQLAFAARDDTDGLILFNPGGSGTNYKSWIDYDTCDPYADPLTDGERTGTERSCIGTGDNLDSFRIKIHHYISEIEEGNVIMGIGESKYSTVGLGGLTFFSTELVGDKVCVFASILGITAGVPAKDSFIHSDFRQSESFDLQISETNGLLNGKINPGGTGAEPIDPYFPWHCLPAPTPVVPEIDVDWGELISDVCTDYNSVESQFKYTSGATRSFSGVVVECIEQTMNNVFTYQDDNGDTFFIKMKRGLVSAVMALLVLYVVIFGYQFIIGKRGIKQHDWHWFVLKAALVMFFAVGPGMTIVQPWLQSISKDLALMVMTASSGNQTQAETAQNNLASAENALRAANLNVVAARKALASNPDSSTNDLNEALATMNTVRTEYNTYRRQASSFGYPYCDFSDLTYTAGKEYMRLWDMVDCKLAKYLGVGDNPASKEQPQMLILSFALLFSHPAGFLIFALTVVLLIFIIKITLRMVHIYIFASTGLILLVYISPLIIPAVLFQHTKSIFDGWISQILSYTIQPIILFTFLAMLFAIFDTAIYKGNHYFVPMSSAHSIHENRLCMKVQGSTSSSENGVCTAADFDANTSSLECDDNSALGCIYQRLSVNTSFAIFGFRFYKTNATNKNIWDFLSGLLVMLVIAFISHSVLSLVETMSGTLTNAFSSAGGGASGMSGFKSSSPLDIHNKTTGKLGSAAAKAVRATGRGSAKAGLSGYKAARKGVSNLKNRLASSKSGDGDKKKT